MKARFLGVSFALMLLAAGCGDGGEKKARRIAAPGSAHAVIVERTDLGACCGTRMVGHLEAFEEANSRTELFEIKGSSELSVQWDGPYNLVIGACNANEVHHRSGIWKKDVSAQLFVSLTNNRGKKTTDGIECEQAGKVHF